MKAFPFRTFACNRSTLLLSTDDDLALLCQMVFSRKICFERCLMSGAPYLAWLLSQEDTLRLSPLEECLEVGWA
jgi:hypothetical protein